MVYISSFRKSAFHCPSAPLLYSPPKGLTHYELKNWSGWGSWSDKAFREQFLKDLAERSPLKTIFGSKVNDAESLIRAIDKHDAIFDIVTL